MRMIDADALKKQMCQICNENYSDDPCEPNECVFRNAIDSAPTIDAVPVVRCKDCEHGEFEQENRMWACVRCADYDADFDMFTGFIEYHNEQHFCSYGERRSDD